MRKFRHLHPLTAFIAISILLPLEGCSLFFGTVKVDERSDRYTVMDLAQKDPSQWTKLAREVSDPPGDSGGSSDWTYQSSATGAIISANSSCRGVKPVADPEIQKSLRAQTKLLMLGIYSIQPKAEREITVAGQPALESTIEGKMGREKIRMRAVVLRHGRCQYDLIYIARPNRFAENEALFAQFIDSLRIRE